MTITNQSLADVQNCIICGQLEQTDKMFELDETSLSVQAGICPVGALMCAECYEED